MVIGLGTALLAAVLFGGGAVLQAVAARRGPLVSRLMGLVVLIYVLGWALHEAGSNTQALPYARRASALGARNAGYLFHIAMIELSLGKTGDARRDLRAALVLNPHFSPRYAPLAQAALSRLGVR